MPTGDEGSQASEHEDMLEWVGGHFDPTVFNAYDVNRAFHGGGGPRRPDA